MNAETATALLAARSLLPVAALCLLAWLWRRGSPAAALVAPLAGGAFVWAISTLPLARLYAAGPSHDRLGNLALAQVVAAGNPAWETAQPGQMSFEPLWGLFAATLSGFSPERLLALYDRLPLIPILGFPLALWFLLRERPGWERAVVVAFSALLCSSPLDFHGDYRSPWAMTFLLKPNHALGLVLFPIVLDRFVAIRTNRDRLVAGAWLHLLAWVFVLHMAYVAIGLALFAVASGLQRRPEAGADFRDALVTVGVNVLIASPYLLILVFTYPFLEPGGDRMAIPYFSPHLLEPTLRVGAPFLLAAWGGVVLFRRGDRLSRVLWTQAAAALAFWAFYLVLGHFELARERDEIYYWVRFLGALLAGFGAWDLLGRAVAAPALLARWPAALGAALQPERARAALLLGLALPWSVPVVWDPPRMDRYYGPSLSPVPERMREAGDFLRRNTPPDSVVACDLEYARWVSSLGARRVLRGAFLHGPPQWERRDEFTAALLRGESLAEFADVEPGWNVTHLLVTPDLLAEHPGTGLEALRRRPDLKTVFSWEQGGDFVVIFERTR